MENIVAGEKRAAFPGWRVVRSLREMEDELARERRDLNSKEKFELEGIVMPRDFSWNGGSMSSFLYDDRMTKLGNWVGHKYWKGARILDNIFDVIAAGSLPEDFVYIF